MPDFFSAIDDYDARMGRHRTPDHATSVEGAQDVKFRAGAQKAKLLQVYGALPDSDDPEIGYTNEEAAIHAGLLRGCPWKRVGEMVAAGLIEWTGATRRAESGSSQEVKRITDKGRKLLARLG